VDSKIYEHWLKTTQWGELFAAYAAGKSTEITGAGSLVSGD
jgi:hypothetical protein